MSEVFVVLEGHEYEGYGIPSKAYTSMEAAIRDNPAPWEVSSGASGDVVATAEWERTGWLDIVKIEVKE